MVEGNEKPPFRWIPPFIFVGLPLMTLALGFGLPLLGRIGEASPEARDRRNAQQLASVCGAVSRAEVDWVGEGHHDVEKVVALAVKGTTVDNTSSPFHGTFFGVPGLTAVEQKAAGKYLTLTNGMLVYSDP